MLQILLLILSASVAASYQNDYNALPAVGCYISDGVRDVLLRREYRSHDMTQYLCGNLCLARSYALFGLISGDTCYCGDYLQGATRVRDGFCIQKCSGNSRQTCGSLIAMQVFRTQPGRSVSESGRVVQSLAPNSAITPTAVGCYWSDRIDVLSRKALESNDMTQRLCGEMCSALSYKYFGLKNGRECYCGDNPQGGERAAHADCMWRCSGNAMETCGGGFTMLVFKVSGYATSGGAATGKDKQWPLVGCYLSNNWNPFLTHQALESDAMTHGACRAACDELAYRYFGLRQGRICFCGRTLYGGVKLSAANCMWRCSGNLLETCGSDTSVQVHETGSQTLVQSGQLEAPGEVVGCYLSVSSNNALQHNALKSVGMTRSLCASTCDALASTYFGLTSGNTCHCGNHLNGAIKLPRTKCMWPCSGLRSDNCGSNVGMQIFKMSQHPPDIGVYPSGTEVNSPGTNVNPQNTGVNPPDTTVTPTGTGVNPPDTTVTPSGTGVDRSAIGADISRTHVGCYLSDDHNLFLKRRAFKSNTMTQRSCAEKCFMMSFEYGGLSTGDTCHCDNSIHGGAKLDNSQCRWRCRGDAAETCGSKSAMKVFKISAIIRTPAGKSVTTPHTGISTSATLVGCYMPDGSGSFMPGHAFKSNTMTQGSCREKCLSLSYKYGGLKSGHTCNCGNSLNGGFKLSDKNCRFRCTGDLTEICGSDSAILVIKTQEQSNVKSKREADSGILMRM